MDFNAKGILGVQELKMKPQNLQEDRINIKKVQ